MITLDSTQRELLRQNLLQTAAASAPNGVTLIIFRTYARPSGFHKVTEEQIAAEVQYLVDKELLTPVAKEISPVNKAWRITAKGQDYVEEHGLA